MSSADPELSVVRTDGTSLVFEFEAGPLEISPGLARVLLRIMRKAAERRGMDLEGTNPVRPLASRPS